MNRKNHDPLEELNQQQEHQSTAKKYNLITLVSVSIVAVAVTITAFYLYNSYQDKTDGEVVVITVDDNEIKVKPENPGGMVVDNMDKVVYDTINGQKVEEETPRILPAPEEPLDRTALVIEQEDPKDNDLSEDIMIIEPTVNNEVVVNEVIEVVEEASPQDNPSKDSQKEDSKQQEELKKSSVKIKKVIKKDEEYIDPITKEDSDKLSIAVPKLEKFYKVQVASFRSKSDAEKEWKNLSRKHPKLIGSYKNYIVAKNIEGKGLFYRLQIGPFNNDAEANKACKALKSAGINCLIVKP